MLALAPLVIATIAILACTALTLASIVAVFRATGRAPAGPTAPPRASPPVTILKPLCGADDDLEENLATFFALDYPDFELVFGVEGAADPAIAVVRRLRALHPTVRARLVIHDGGRALNPKVSNLQAILAVGAHDLVLISDSNIAVGPGELRAMVDTLESDPRTGLVTSLFAGVGEQTLGATLENLHLVGAVAGGIAATGVMSPNAVCVGKSMLFRRSTLDGLGGLGAVANVLAEDYVVGCMFATAGYRVRLSPSVIDNTCKSTTVRRFLARHRRWALIRSRVAPLLYPFEWLANPMATALLAAALGVAGPLAVTWGLALTLLRDALQWLRLRGRRGLAMALPLGPLKELAMLAVWASAPFQRRVSWRGRSFRVGTGTRLYAEAPVEPPAMLRCE